MSLRARARSVAKSIVLDERAPDGSQLIEYQPGNGTRYVVMFQNTDAFSQQALNRVGWQRGTVLVSLLNFERSRVSPYPAAPGSFIHYAYLQDKMGVGEHDARVLAELIAYVLPGREAISAEEGADVE